jgi:hypothetical protein
MRRKKSVKDPSSASSASNHHTSTIDTMAQPPAKRSRTASPVPDEIVITSRDADTSASSRQTVDVETTDENQPGTVLMERCMRIHGWDLQKARKIMKAYRQFLHLKMVHQDWDDTLLWCSPLIEQMWHMHMLDPVHYCTVTTVLCDGHVLGCNPDAALDPEDQKVRFDRTRASLEEHFKGEYDKEIWDVEDELKVQKVDAYHKKYVGAPKDIRRFLLFAAAMIQLNMLDVAVLILLKVIRDQLAIEDDQDDGETSEIEDTKDSDDQDDEEMSDIEGTQDTNQDASSIDVHSQEERDLEDVDFDSENPFGAPVVVLEDQGNVRNVAGGFGNDATTARNNDAEDGSDGEDTTTSELYPDEVKVHLVYMRPGQPNLIFRSIVKRKWQLSSAFIQFERFVRENHNNFQIQYNGNDFHIDGRTTANSLRKAGFGKNENEKLLRLTARSLSDIRAAEAVERTEAPHTYITIRVKNQQNEEEITVRMTRATQMKRVFAAFYAKTGICPGSCAFFLNSNRELIHWMETPLSLKLYDQGSSGKLDGKAYISGFDWEMKSDK